MQNEINPGEKLVLIFPNYSVTVLPDEIIYSFKKFAAGGLRDYRISVPNIFLKVFNGNIYFKTYMGFAESQILFEKNTQAKPIFDLIARQNNLVILP